MDNTIGKIRTIPGDRVDNLAYKYLGSVDKYKVLMEANPEFDPFNLTISVELEIPNG